MDTRKRERLEENFRILAIFKLPWDDIKKLDDDERSFFLEKADEVEQQVMQQAKMQQQRMSSPQQV